MKEENASTPRHDRHWVSQHQASRDKGVREQAEKPTIFKLGAAAIVPVPLSAEPWQLEGAANTGNAPLIDSGAIDAFIESLGLANSTGYDEHAMMRTQALTRLDALRHQGDEIYQFIAHMAASVCQTPIALISLLDNATQWFQARVGVDLDYTPLEVSFCQHAIRQPGTVTVMRDTLKDARVSFSPFVLDEPYLRFYAGAPIVLDDGVVLGTVCVADTRVRDVNAEQRQTLRMLARHTAQLLQNRAPRSGTASLLDA